MSYVLYQNMKYLIKYEWTIHSEYDLDISIMSFIYIYSGIYIH